MPLRDRRGKQRNKLHNTTLLQHLKQSKQDAPLLTLKQLPNLLVKTRRILPYLLLRGRRLIRIAEPIRHPRDDLAQELLRDPQILARVGEQEDVVLVEQLRDGGAARRVAVEAALERGFEAGGHAHVADAVKEME